MHSSGITDFLFQIYQKRKRKENAILSINKKCLCLLGPSVVMASDNHIREV